MSTASAPSPTVPGEPTTVEKLRGLRWSISSNVANTIFVQFTFFGSVFVLFLNELGLSKGEVGFVLSLLPFSGLISLVVAPAVARFGYKRTYLTFWTARSVVSALMLLTPWVLVTFGRDATLFFVSATVATFAILRSIGVTANLPWVQEYVPDSVRGKYTASSNMFTSLAGFVAISGGGWVLGRVTGLPGFVILIAVGVIAGFASVWLATYIPGGAPRPAQASKSRDLGAAIRDRRFLFYLIGIAVLTLATVPLNSFVPLFMQEEIGLSSANVVLLQIGALSGGLLSSYIWGWAADRYGSKPVMLWGLGLRIVIPVLWTFMPRQEPWNLYAALGISLLSGVADMGWGIGSARMLYVSIVPATMRSDYMAFYNAWVGIAGGVSQILGGWILQASQGIGGQAGFLILTPYLPLFAMGIVLPTITIVVLNTIRSDERVGMGEFVGIFLRGNPFLAMTSMIRFHLARDESATVTMTQRLARAQSPLAVDELLEALRDPRFNVRFEAIVAMAQMPTDPRLTDALIEILHGSELSLSVVAAWALGRIGDQNAYEPLRQGLASDYRSIKAHSARALGGLGNAEIVPVLMERLSGETDKGLQMAYASALGALEAREATDELLNLLDHTQNEGARLELALSLARIVGSERYFIQLLRGARSDLGTTLAQEVGRWKRVLARDEHAGALQAEIDACAAALARSDLESGMRAMGRILKQVEPGSLGAAEAAILATCARQLQATGAAHMEYALLAAHVLREIET